MRSVLVINLEGLFSADYSAEKRFIIDLYIHL